MSVFEKKIVVAGLTCLDMTPHFKVNKKIDIKDLFRPGKAVRTTGMDISPGGVVSNTGLGLAKLGANVHIMTKIGNDPIGDILENELNKYDISKTIVKSDEDITGHSIVIAVPGNDRIFMHDVGIIDSYSEEDMDFNIIEEASIFHFGYPQCMRSFYENSGMKLKELFKRIKGMGIVTSMDMSLADPEEEASKVDWQFIIKETIPYIDIFVPSAEELSMSIDPVGYMKLNDKANKDDKTFIDVLTIEYVEQMAELLILWGAKIVLIKCGEKGMYLRTSDQGKLKEVENGIKTKLIGWENQMLYMKCFKPEKICSGTGAGDISIAAFLYAMQLGKTAKRSVELAAGAGALCVATYDVLSGIPLIDEIEKRIDSGWEKSE